MISKKVLGRLIEEGLSQKKIAGVVGCSETSVRYWTKKHGLETAFGPHGARRRQSGCKDAEKKVCSVCGSSYTRKGRLCPTCFTNVRRVRAKIAAVVLLGGSCSRCGWSGDLRGFAFHHVQGKKFNVGDMLNYPWSTVKKELKKCELLCVRCHVLEHSVDRSELFVEFVKNYSGRDSEIRDAVSCWFDDDAVAERRGT